MSPATKGACLNVSNGIPSDNAVLRHIKSMPKVELHRHLEGSIRFSTLKELFRSHVHGGNLPANLDGEENEHALEKAVRDHFCVDHRINNLTEFLDKFEHTQQVLASTQILERVTYEACEDAALCGIVLLELRYSPVYILRGHTDTMKVDSIHAAVVAGMQRAMKTYPNLAVGLIGILDRCSSLEDATEAADFFIANRDTFVGVDLANDEERFDGRHLSHLFKNCRDAGLKVTIHAGEVPSPNAPVNVNIAMDEFYATRIGHGIHVLRDATVTAKAKEKGIAFEVCPTSNVLIGTVDSLEEHPLREMLDNGLNVTISTDDPGLFVIDMNSECIAAVEGCGMTLKELWSAQVLGYESCFIPKAGKDTKWQQAVKKWSTNGHNLLRDGCTYTNGTR